MWAVHALKPAISAMPQITKNACVKTQVRWEHDFIMPACTLLHKISEINFRVFYELQNGYHCLTCIRNVF